MRFGRLRLDWRRTPFGLFRDPRFLRQGRWIALSALIGSVGGVGAILFDLVFRLCQHGLLEGLGRFRPPPAGGEGGVAFGPEHPWLLLVPLVIGGLATGAIVFGLAPETEGHGTDEVIQAFHHGRGKIRRRVPLVKAVTSALTIGSGGSAGREGPIAQIGAGFGSFLGDALRVTNHERRVLMMAGVAGGIGAIFRAPLGAALFACEVLYTEAEFEYEVLVPGLISAITGYSIYASYAGWDVLFRVPDISYHEPEHLLLYAVLGVLCAAAGRIYPPFFYGLRDRFFRRLPLPRWTRPAFGAALLGLLAVAFPQVLGMGYGYIQEAIDGHHTIAFLLGFAALKIVAVSLTLSSGGSGGVFGPSLVIGGALGGACGYAAQRYLPGIAPEPVACVMVGMCGFFAGVAKTPLAAVIMVMEMTGSYGLLVPCLLVATIAYLALPPSVKIYERQVPSRLDSPAHTGSFAIDLLRLARVGDAYQPIGERTRTPRTDVSLAVLVKLVAESRQTVFPVVDATGALRGELSLEDVRLALLEQVPQEAVIAADLMHEVHDPLVPEDDLAHAARVLAGHPGDATSVVRDRATREVVGVFSRRDLIVAYGAQSDRMGEDEIAT